MEDTGQDPYPESELVCQVNDIMEAGFVCPAKDLLQTLQPPENSFQESVPLCVSAPERWYFQEQISYHSSATESFRRAIMSSQPGKGGVKRAKALVQGRSHSFTIQGLASPLSWLLFWKDCFWRAFVSDIRACCSPRSTAKTQGGAGIRKSKQVSWKMCSFADSKVKPQREVWRKESSHKEKGQTKASNDDNKNNKPLELKEWPHNHGTSFRAKLDNKAHLNSLNGCDGDCPVETQQQPFLYFLNGPW